MKNKSRKAPKSENVYLKLHVKVRRAVKFRVLVMCPGVLQSISSVLCHGTVNDCIRSTR